MNIISADVLVEFLDRGAQDGSPTAGAGTSITTKMREYEVEDMADAIETGGFGIRRVRGGKVGFRYTIGLLVDYTGGPITAVVGHYASIDTTFGGLAELTGSIGIILRNMTVVNDNQEAIQRITIEGPADIT